MVNDRKKEQAKKQGPFRLWSGYKSEIEVDDIVILNIKQEGEDGRNHW